MKPLKKCIVPIILLISFPNLFGQNSKAQVSEGNVYQAMSTSEVDLMIRINEDMNDRELKTRLDILHGLDEGITINYSRDESGNIKTFASNGGKNKGSCKSDDFGFVIISLKDNHWSGCMISDKK